RDQSTPPWKESSRKLDIDSQGAYFLGLVGRSGPIDSCLSGEEDDMAAIPERIAPVLRECHSPKQISRHTFRASLLAIAGLTLNECANLGPSDANACNAIVSAGFSGSPSVPDDAFVSGVFTGSSGDGTGSTQARINAFETNEGNRTIVIKGGASITASSFDAV